jgi:methyl-accepting chemotaxis protein
MTPKQVQLCKDSWAKVEPIASTAADIFYNNLFAADPSLQTLFKGDMPEQGKKLMDMIGAAVRLLDKPEKLIPVVQNLGIRHAGYGVENDHYDTVGSALIKTLATGLGDDFTEEVEQSWLAAYGILASTMQQAANLELV